MIVRLATFDDAESIARIHTVSWQEVYREEMDREYLTRVVPGERLELWRRRLEEPEREQRVIVAEEEGRLVGFACLYLHHHPRYGSYLDNLHVLSSHRGAGIGARLLGEVGEICRMEAPQEGLCLLVTEGNRKARSFYLFQGGEIAEETIWEAPDGSRIPSRWIVWREGKIENGKSDPSSGE